jgi:hypothetical protein
MSSHLFRGALDCALDAWIGSAPADVAVHVPDNLFVTRLRILGQQRRGLHDLARLAVTALYNLLRIPCFLQRMLTFGVQPLDSGDSLSDSLRDGKRTRPNGITVDVYRACSTLRDPTAEFGSGHL